MTAIQTDLQEMERFDGEVKAWYEKVKASSIARPITPDVLKAKDQFVKPYRIIFGFREEAR
ncbi:hypothetical protein [Butyrivibrio sp. WCD2001]|uniref:hypothetical protein n=1 Tax=Butyrivibrio sp. WCD2001 TaxID=1280681 RepID=UPI0004095BAF|nr:hypothetical protein [Butyrivibrio sp. WCD2001]